MIKTKSNVLEEMISSQKKNGLYVDKPTIYVAAFVAFTVLATVGLVCGFAGRKTCPKPIRKFNKNITSIIRIYL